MGSTDGYVVIPNADITCQVDDAVITDNALAQCVIDSDSLTMTTNSRTQTYRVRYVIDDNGRNAAAGTMIAGA